MAIYLAQHGKAFSEEDDPRRALTNLGIKETVYIASTAAYYMVAVDQIQHSSKLRAKQTAEVFGLKLKPSRGLIENPELDPDGNFKLLGESLKPEYNILLVGHLPFLQRLLSQMTTGSPDFEIMKLQNSGLICLDKAPDDKTWHIKWSLSRHIS